MGGNRIKRRCGLGLNVAASKNAASVILENIAWKDGFVSRKRAVLSCWAFLAWGILSLSPFTEVQTARCGELEFTAIDKETQAPVAARMHLKDQRGRVVRPKGVPFWKDHFVFDGKIVLDLKPGHYTFEIERGPEYRFRSGYFEMERDGADTKTIEMIRFVDMKKEGWWSGDLHIHRSPEDIELLMRAEDLHIGPVITWWNDRNVYAQGKFPEKPLGLFDENRFYHLLAGEDERNGGALLYFNLAKPLSLPGSKRRHPEYPSPVKYLKLARRQAGAHIDIEKPFWWDMPIWVASQKCDSIGLANNHMQRDGALDNEAWGKPRDKVFYPGAIGNGRWSQDIYYRLLNCGLRIPPSAGSASGVLPNPVGYNRVYVYCGDTLNYNTWWENLRAGKVVVTNGPLLRPRVNGEVPGHVFTADEGQEVELQIALNLATRDKIDYLEIIQNGDVVQQVRLADWAQAGGKLPPLTFQSSGWMLIRAVTNYTKSYRFASTGPYYVQIGEQRRISKEAASFFSDWVEERARRVKISDPQQRAEVLKYHRAARKYWRALEADANVE